jgi:hypothetical protein
MIIKHLLVSDHLILYHLANMYLQIQTLLYYSEDDVQYFSHNWGITFLLKSINSWCTVPVYSHFFSSIWQKQSRSILCHYSNWWSPIMSSTYEIKLERTVIKILYEADKSVCESHNITFYLLLELILPKFGQNLVNYTFPTSE